MLERIQVQPQFCLLFFCFCFFLQCVGYAQIKYIKYFNVKIASSVCVDLRQNYISTNMSHFDFKAKFQTSLPAGKAVDAQQRELYVCKHVWFPPDPFCLHAKTFFREQDNDFENP